MERNLEVRSKNTTSPIQISHPCSNFSSYLKYTLGMDIRANGFLSALPYLVRYLGGILHGKASDALYRRRLLRLVTIRRIFNSIAKAPLSQRGSSLSAPEGEGAEVSKMAIRVWAGGYAHGGVCGSICLSVCSGAN